jgi:low molecular weight phosphotyrosine protein phosphatase
MSEKKGILMICLGNICRSPIAEAVMIDTVKKQNVEGKFNIDSAAIGKHKILNKKISKF